MGNRAVEMMVDTGAQTSAAQLQPCHIGSPRGPCVAPGDLDAAGENVGLGVAAGQSIPRTGMRDTHTQINSHGKV